MQRNVMVDTLDCGIVVSEFELQSRCYVHFRTNTLKKDMNTATRVQILDETNCISHSTYTLGKGMNPIILPPAMGK